MDVLRIVGGKALRGAVAVSGSKNAALPVMAASLLTGEDVWLRNVPDIEDIEVMAETLRHLGVRVEREGRAQWCLNAAGIRAHAIGAELTRRMRGSFLLFGPLVARCGEARIAKPGGDDIGMRRVEQHLEGLRLMGAEVREEESSFVASAKRLRGARIDLDIPTVTGTENLIMAAVCAEGITVISNAAREPHIVDLVRCLAGMGAHITGAGTDLIVIEGGRPLHGTQHAVTTDYIEAGTYMVAAAATGGEVVVEEVRPADVRWLTNKLRAAGAQVDEGNSYVRVKGGGGLHSVDVTTWPHPGFATDLQPQFGALMTQAKGTSVVSEALYENRFRHVAALKTMGASIEIEGRSSIITGPCPLRGAQLQVPDIRSGAALVIAALCAQGESELHNIFHLDRGYEDLEEKLGALGADAKRVSLSTSEEPVRDYSAAIGE